MIYTAPDIKNNMKKRGSLGDNDSQKQTIDETATITSVSLRYAGGG